MKIYSCCSVNALKSTLNNISWLACITFFTFMGFFFITLNVDHTFLLWKTWRFSLELCLIYMNTCYEWIQVYWTLHIVISLLIWVFLLCHCTFSLYYSCMVNCLLKHMVECLLFLAIYLTLYGHFLLWKTYDEHLIYCFLCTLIAIWICS